MDKTTKMQLVIIMLVLTLGILLLMYKSYSTGGLLVTICLISLYTEILPSWNKGRDKDDKE
jgi:hypothetical protein